MFLHYKKRFQTCLQMLGDVREQFPVLQHEILSYAGILDPMAEGWVTVLVGKEENRDRVRHTESIKEYIVQILVGVDTDSGDLMGVVGGHNNQYTISQIITYIENFPDRYLQKISRFANKKYKSKPLWWYQLNEVDLPEEALVEREVQIFDKEVLGIRELSIELLIDEIGAMAEVFGTTFRMEKILPSWGEYFGSKFSDHTLKQGVGFQILEVRLVVSKGFFVRQWVQDLGEKVGVPMVVYSLKRTKVFG